jgi:hypothetical protein
MAVVGVGVVGADRVVYYAYPSFLERSNAVHSAIDNGTESGTLNFLSATATQSRPLFEKRSVKVIDGIWEPHRVPEEAGFGLSRSELFR